MKRGNPDKGPQMQEGAHHFDKGYTSDDELVHPAMPFENDNYRGNQYFDLMNSANSKDKAKIKSGKFSKIA